MKTDMYFYCVIIAVFYTLSHAYGTKVSVVSGNEMKQHNLSCENGGAIEIKRGVQIFGKNYRKCDFQNYSCRWEPESPTQRFCSIGDHIKASFSCDGLESCITNSPDDPGISCCNANGVCENRLGYKIDYDCVQGLKKLDLNPNQKEFSISGKDIIIKVPFDSNRNCSCRVVTETTGYFKHKYYYLANTGNNIITDYYRVKGGRKFSFHRDGDVLQIVKTGFSGSQENEGILNVTCTCSYDVNHIQTTTARPTFRPKSTVFTSTQSSVETQENPGYITISGDGNNRVVIITVVGVGLVNMLIFVVFFLLMKRSVRTKNQTINSNSGGEAATVKATVPDDGDYSHLSEIKNDNYAQLDLSSSTTVRVAQ